LASVHRVENTDVARNLEQITEALALLDDIVFPCHPRTEARLKQQGLWNEHRDKVTIIKPIGYLDMLVLESRAHQILTNSGGIQKDAYMLKVPCITMRMQTEWVETVEDGWNILTGAKKEKILQAAMEFKGQTIQRNVFGKGASQRIVGINETKNTLFRFFDFYQYTLC